MSKISHKMSNGVNHQNKIIKANSLSLSLSRKNTLKVFKASSFVFIAATLVVSGFFAPQQAFAAATVIPATNGTNVSIDTTAHVDCVGVACGTYKTLSGPGINELVAKDISTGVHTITLPAGWEFEISTINISTFGSDIALASTAITPSATSFSFAVTSQSTTGGFVGFSGLKVRPTVTNAPSTGNMTYSGAGIVGVDVSTNFGTLTTVPGMVTKLVFTTGPGGAVYGSLLNPQPVVRTQDQFGNNSTSGLVATEMVSLTLTGTGVLQGTATLNIGTGAGTPGTVTFTDLKVGGVGAVGTKGLTASADGLTSAVSNNFEITQKPLTATVTVNNKPYDGNNSAVITGVTLNGVEPGDDVTVGNQGTATFASPNANTGIVVTSNGVTIIGAHAGNYTFNNTATGTANIDKRPITVTANTGQTKVYGEAELTLTYTPSESLIPDNSFTGALSRVIGEDVGVYAITQGNLSAGNNYNITFVADNFSITKRPITVEATASSKVYDGNTTSAGIPTITTGTLATGDSANFIQVYSTTDVNTGKKLTPSGTADGNSGNNYEYTFTYKMNGTITEKELIVSGLSVSNKVYNGNINTTVNGTPSLVGVVGTDDVSVAGTATGSFNDANVGSRTVAITGLSLIGTAMGNYTLIQPVLNAEITPLGITGSFTADNKVYNGTTIATVLTQSLTGVLPGDVGNVVLTGGTASFATRNVGDNIMVTASGMVLGGSASGNYNLTSVDTTTADITVKYINVTAQPDTKTYDGTKSSSVAPVVDSLETGDTVGIAPTQAYDTEDVGTGKTMIASGLIINDGFGGANYLVTNVNNQTGVIEAKNLTVIGATTVPKTYDGELDAIVNFDPDGLVGIVGGEDVSLDSTGYSAEFDNKNVGTGKTVTVSGLDLDGTDASNYSLTQPVLNDGVITKREITVTAVLNTKTYDGLTTAAATPTITAGTLASGDVGTFTETYDNANVGTTHVLTPAGTIADAYSIDMTGNYDITFTTIATGIINKAPLTITADDKNKVYGAANPTLTVSYSGFVNSENASVLDTPVSLSTTAVDASSVGIYPITASGAADTNYEISFTSGTLTVTPAPITVTADAKSKTYGEADPALTYQITSGSLLVGDTLTGSLSRVAGGNVGDYAITSTLAHSNYNITFISANLTVNKKPITVTAVTNTKIYDGNTSAAGTPTFTGSLVGTDTANFTEAYDNKNVGTGKTLTPSGVVNDDNSGNNYSYTFVTDTTGVITPLGITITPTAGQTKVYGNADPVFAYTFTPALIDGSFTGALGRATGDNVGTYAYALGNLSAGGNYTLTLTPGTFAITKATPVITWANPANIVYGDVLSGTQLNATADVAGAFVYAPVSGTVLNAGVGQTLSVTFTPTDTGNYNNAEETVLITVTPAPLTITADDKNKVYGTTLTFSGTEFTKSGLVGSDTVTSVTLTSDGSPASAIADDYEIVPSAAVGSGLSNYDITYDDGTLTVTDTVAPTVISHTPSFNALNISPTTAIVVTFSEPVVVEEEDISFSPAISGGFTITDSKTDVVTITPNDPLEDNTTYTITLDGVADINGLSLPTYSDIKFTTATNYSINLNANASGWNLISLPVVPSNTAIATVLGSAADNIDAVWTYDPTNPNAVDGWLVFVPGNPEDTNNLTLMTAGFGYWVSVTGNANLSGSGTLLIAGPTPPPSRSLQTGWNLIGYYQLPNEDTSTPVSAFASIGAPGVGYNGLWGFDNTTGFFNSVTTINPGDAFWISLPSVKTYTPSNIE